MNHTSVLYVEDIGLTVLECSKFEWFNNRLMSLCQEPWQGGCLERHIASKHYKVRPKMSVKSNFIWLLVGLFRVQDSSNNFDQI